MAKSLFLTMAWVSIEIAIFTQGYYKNLPFNFSVKQKMLNPMVLLLGSTANQYR
jgi:hypothetical protein